MITAIQKWQSSHVMTFAKTIGNVGYNFGSLSELPAKATAGIGAVP